MLGRGRIVVKQVGREKQRQLHLVICTRVRTLDFCGRLPHSPKIFFSRESASRSYSNVFAGRFSVCGRFLFPSPSCLFSPFPVTLDAKAHFLAILRSFFFLSDFPPRSHFVVVPGCRRFFLRAPCITNQLRNVGFRPPSDLCDSGSSFNAGLL